MIVLPHPTLEAAAEAGDPRLIDHAVAQLEALLELVRCIDFDIDPHQLHVLERVAAHVEAGNDE